MFYKVECTVDTNDADYNTQTSRIDEKELAMLKSICERIKKFKPYEASSSDGWKSTHRHNFTTGDCFRKDLGEKSPVELYDLTEEEEEFFVCKICPSCDYGFHTIDLVMIYPYVEGECLI